MQKATFNALSKQVLKWNATDSKWIPAPDDAGLSNVNLFATVAGDTGSTTADSSSDTLTVTGGNDIVTSVVGDTLTIDFNGSPITTFAGLTDTNTAGLAQGNSIFYDGLSWVRTSSPIIWWDLGSDGSSHFTFAGPGFASATVDPDLYVMTDPMDAPNVLNYQCTIHALMNGVINIVS